MAIKNLTNEEVIQLLDAYKHAILTVLGQSNHQDEDRELLMHMLLNVKSVQDVLATPVPKNNLSWQIMTSIAGSPQVLNSTQIHPFQYDTEQNINQNIQLLYHHLLLRNYAATQDLERHINRNNQIEFISGLLALTSILINELLALGSAWGQSFLMPLCSTLAPALVVVLFLSIGIARTARLHSCTLKELHWTHDLLTDLDSMENKQKTARFFQPNHANPLLDRIEQSFTKT